MNKFNNKPVIFQEVEEMMKFTVLKCLQLLKIQKKNFNI